jgi:Pyruvate/2-oxoglutarate dehydrogenase complex, dihydrolipoamide dehydrogenase (E3) component, and related enzymes
MFDPRYITTRRVRPIALILRKLGFAAFWPEAGELMGNVQVAMLAGALYTLLRDAVFTHPTMSESLGMLFARVPKRRYRLRRNANTRQSARKD